MNPSFPLPSQDLFPMSSITLMIMITFIMQGSLIAVSARVIKAYKGVREASIATFSLAIAYLILVVAGPPTALTGYLSNLLLVCGYFLIYLALCRFTGTTFSRPVVFLSCLLGFLAITLTAIFHPPWLHVLSVSLFVGIVINLSSVIVLLRSDHRRFKVSAYLTATPLFVYTLNQVWRLIAGFISRTEILPVPSMSGLFSALALFVLSYLWTAGFILMVSQRLQGDLNDLAMNDALTRIRNRRAMKEMLDFEMNRVDQEVRDFSIILLDVDHFKYVNDTYGHDVGDSVLRWFASTLQSNMRIQDVVARWGGEEFMILLPDTSLEEAMQIAERLRAVIEKSVVEILSGILQITFSAGVSCSTTSREVSHLCKIADQALYIAKETRNRVVSQDAIPVREVVNCI